MITISDQARALVTLDEEMARLETELFEIRRKQQSLAAQASNIESTLKALRAVAQALLVNV